MYISEHNVRTFPHTCVCLYIGLYIFTCTHTEMLNIHQAVAAGGVVRVVASMGLTSGRAVQLNGLQAGSERSSSTSNEVPKWR